MDLSRRGIWGPWLGRLTGWLNRWLDGHNSIEYSEHIRTPLCFTSFPAEAQTVHYLVRFPQEPGYAVLSYEAPQWPSNQNDSSEGDRDQSIYTSLFGLYLARAFSRMEESKEKPRLRQITVQERDLLEAANLDGTLFRGIAHLGPIAFRLEFWLSDLLATNSLSTELFAAVTQPIDTARPDDLSLMVARWKFPENLRNEMRPGDLLLMPSRVPTHSSPTRAWLLVGEFLWPVHAASLNGGHFCLEEDAPVFSNERICWDQMMYACANHGQLCTSNLQNVVSGQVESNDLPETELSLWANGLIWGWGRWVMFDNRLGMRVERLSAR